LIFRKGLISFTDNLHFDYIFASEEYPEFSCSEYNDVFGFFISGPGITGNRNIALIPNTNLPVSIANVHPDFSTYLNPCPPQNEEYYVNSQYNSYCEFNGHTVMRNTAAITVTPGFTYHLKLAIANVGNKNYGSGVFLRAGSLDLGLGVVNYGNNINGMDNVFEGCINNHFTINLNPSINDVILTLQYSGAAVNDISSPDGSPLPTTVTIPYTVNSPVTVNGGDFNIAITANSLLCFGDEYLTYLLYFLCKYTTYLSYLQVFNY
jgi:hypothetical protein